MKYIIEIKPEYEDTTRGIMVLGAKDSNLYMNVLAVDDLEELTADYINEHYGQMQDDACQRGLEDGKAQSERGCEGCKYANVAGTHEPCVRCSNSYKNQWKAKDDKIEVGDEVNWLGDCFIVTRIFQPRNMKEQCDGIDDDGCVYQYVPMDDLEKTGRHFDIAKILEEMRCGQ